tara:strand:+ start:4934 stop:5119 length:186 start_codon:yes stop_codon:yes gene_type:complete
MNICPDCNSSNLLPIIYGYPNADLKKKLDRGEAVSGGCEIWGGEPNWRCKDCNNEFRSKYD